MKKLLICMVMTIATSAHADLTCTEYIGIERSRCLEAALSQVDRKLPPVSKAAFLKYRDALCKAVLRSWVDAGANGSGPGNAYAACMVQITQNHIDFLMSPGIDLISPPKLKGTPDGY